MKNSAGRGGCYPLRPKAEVDKILRDLQNSSYPMKAKFNNCFIIHSKYFFAQTCKDVNLLATISLSVKNTTSSPGFLGQWFNNFDVSSSIICSGLHF